MGHPSERRRHPRLDIHIQAAIRLKRNPTQLIPAEIQNLSVSGAMLKIEEPVAAIGQELLLEILTDEGITFHGKVIRRDEVELFLGDEDEMEESVVRWSNGQGQIGIEFINLSLDKRHALEKLVHYLEGLNTTSDLWK